MFFVSVGEWFLTQALALSWNHVIISTLYKTISRHTVMCERKEKTYEKDTICNKTAD